MKLTDKPINIQFGGGCPICKGDNTLILKGIPFKHKVECSACGSKFESRFGIVGKWELIEGSSEYLGKELELSFWKKLRKGEIGKMEVEKRDKQIKAFSKTEKNLSYLLVIILVVVLSAIFIISFTLDYSTLMAASKSFMQIGFMFLILGCVVIGISIGLNRFLKK